jgi:2-C-methyl-D-erythritol 4-phosphate cytidylyltransferase
MIVVGGGSSTRFGTDKLMVEVGGRPLIAHTVDAVREYVDVFVVVCRAEVVTTVEGLATGAIVTPGGVTRTLSEMAGLAALGAGFDLIGIHDAARPSPEGATIERLFTIADETGGAVPVIAHPRQEDTAAGPRAGQGADPSSVPRGRSDLGLPEGCPVRVRGARHP